MTIDERLERLAERHEALTQSVELMVAENRERDRRMAAESKERDRRMVEADRRMAEADRRMGEVMEAIARLLHVAEIHEQRIERLERGPG